MRNDTRFNDLKYLSKFIVNHLNLSGDLFRKVLNFKNFMFMKLSLRYVNFSTV